MECAVIQTVEVRLKTYDPVEVQLEVPAGVQGFVAGIAEPNETAAATARGGFDGAGVVGAGTDSKGGASASKPLKRKRGDGAAEVVTIGTSTWMGKSAQGMKGHSAFLTFAMKFLAQQETGPSV